MKTLVLMRHAKAEHELDVSDIDRALTPRGHRDAEQAAREIRDLVGEAFDAVAVSPSVRTRQTWEALRKGGITGVTVWFDSSIYGGSSPALFEVVRELSEDVSTALVIGHGPAIPETALRLTTSDQGQEAEGTNHDALMRLHEKCPTSSVLVHRVDGTWSDLSAGAAPLTEFLVPRGGRH